MRRYLHCCVFVLSIGLASPAVAITCSSPTLKGASGVIGNKHSYKTTGDCSYTWSETESSSGSSTTKNYALSFTYLGSASWDRQTGEAVERLKITGDSTADRHAQATCSQDPFLKDPPGGAAKCGPVKVQVDVKSGGIYKLLTNAEFWSAKKLSLAEAQALSALPPPSQPPPPSKPKPDVVASKSMPADVTVGDAAPVGGAVGGAGTGIVRADQPPQDAAGRAAVIGEMQRGAGAATGRPTDARRATSPVAGSGQRVASAAPGLARATQMEIEGEALVTSGAYELVGGQARVQQMSGFGSGWGGGAQLFWSEGAPGAVLDLLVDVPAASKYALEIYMTRAPDYGQIQFEVDGKPSEVTFDGMAPQVMTSGPVQLGTFPLQAGQRRVSLMITGKYAQSSGYYVGIDKLRLYPAGPLD